MDLGHLLELLIVAYLVALEINFIYFQTKRRLN